MQATGEDAAENGAAQLQSDAMPAAPGGAAHRLGDRALHDNASGSSSPPRGLGAPVATIAGPQAAADAVCESLVDEGSQPLFESAPISTAAAAAADDQTALANSLNDQPDVKQAAGSSAVLQPAAAPAALREAPDEQPGAEQVAPVPQPLQPAERLAKGREVVALMQE